MKMLFATLFNPPKKGKVLRKRTHNFTSADDAAHHQTAPPPLAITARPPPPDLRSPIQLPLPEITITPGPKTEEGRNWARPIPPPMPADPPRPKAVRRMSGTSLKKRNSHMPPPQVHAQRNDWKEEGQREGRNPNRKSNPITNILEKRRERVEAGNSYYNVYPGREEAEKQYDPSLGVDNLPKPQYSGLLIQSSEYRKAAAAASKEEIGVAVSGDEKRRESSVVRNFRQERREELVDALAGDRLRGKGKQRESPFGGPSTGETGAYWGDLPSQPYRSSYDGIHGGYGRDVGPYEGQYSGGRGYGGEASRGPNQEGYAVVSEEVLNHHPGRPHHHNYSQSLPQRPYTSGDNIRHR